MNPIIQALQSLTKKANIDNKKVAQATKAVATQLASVPLLKQFIYDDKTQKVLPQSPIWKMTGKPEDTQDLAMSIALMGGLQSTGSITGAQNAKNILSQQGDELQRAIDSNLHKVHQSAYTNPKGIEDWAQLDKANQILGARKETPEIIQKATEALSRHTTGNSMSLDAIQAVTEGTKRPLLYQFSKAKGNAEKEAILKHMKIFGGYEDIIPNLKSSMRTVQISPEIQSQIDFMKAHGGRVK